jgi:hypothetical protein
MWVEGEQWEPAVRLLGRSVTDMVGNAQCWTLLVHNPIVSSIHEYRRSVTTPLFAHRDVCIE